MVLRKLVFPFKNHLVTFIYFAGEHMNESQRTTFVSTLEDSEN